MTHANRKRDLARARRGSRDVTVATLNAGGDLPMIATTKDNSVDSDPITLDPTLDAAERLSKAIRMTFQNLEHLRIALTHRSVLHDWAGAGLEAVHLGRPLVSNERLEFLGDAVLGAVVAEHLYGRYPDADEGTLTSWRVALVRSETLVRWARAIDLGSYLSLGHGERISESNRDRILAGAFEAVLGAIMIDRGLVTTRKFVARFLVDDVSVVAAQANADANPKGYLQEVAQERYRAAPVYDTVAMEGPDHAKMFTVEVSLNGQLLGSGAGPSKREAQQAAARNGLRALMETDAPINGSVR